MKIYTRGGDAGETSLFGGERVRKSAPRVAAYGEVDELNSVLGVARAELEAADLRAMLETIQSSLFDLGGELATRGAARLDESQVKALEATIDHCNESLAPLKSFVLPGGGRVSALLHVARTVCRRAERDVLRLMRVDDLGPGPLRYLNRLSDLLFVLSRWIGHQLGETEYLWERPLVEEQRKPKPQ